MRKQLYFLGILLLLFSCRKEKTSWDAQWKFPVLSDTLNMKNWVTDSLLAVNGDGSYQLVINRNLIAFKVDTLIKLPDTTITQKVAISAPSLNLPPGTSFINQIEEHKFDLGETQIKRVNLTSGHADISIKSPIPGKVVLKLILPSVSKDGVVYSKTVTAEAGSISNPSVLTDELDLSGYSIDFTGQNGDTYNTLQSQVQVTTDPNGSYVTITNTDSISFDVHFTDLIPNYGRGYFGHMQFSDTTMVNLDALAHISSGSIDIQNSYFQLEISNGLKISARAKITQFEGINAQNNTVSLSHPQFGIWNNLNQASGTWDNLHPSLLDWIFDDGNSNISTFLENIPKQLKLGYAIELNPLGNDSGGWNEFFSSSEVKVRLTANMPLAIGMSQLTYVDTLAVSIAQNANKTHVKSGTLTIKASNAYPFSAHLSMVALDESNKVLFQLDCPTSIQGSSNLNNYNPTEIVNSTLDYPLTEDQTSQLNSMKHLVLKAVFDTPSGGVAKIYDTHFIFLQLFSDIQLNYKF